MPPDLVLVALSGIAAVTALGFGLMRTVSRHLENKHGRIGLGDLETELRDIRDRLDNLEELQGTYNELEERVDFAERLLSESSEHLKGGA